MGDSFWFRYWARSLRLDARVVRMKKALTTWLLDIPFPERLGS